jgi:hypothetical protein
VALGPRRDRRGSAHREALRLDQEARRMDYVREGRPDMRLRQARGHGWANDCRHGSRARPGLPLPTPQRGDGYQGLRSVVENGPTCRQGLRIYQKTPSMRQARFASEGARSPTGRSAPPKGRWGRCEGWSFSWSWRPAPRSRCRRSPRRRCPGASGRRPRSSARPRPISSRERPGRM